MAGEMGFGPAEQVIAGSGGPLDVEIGGGNPYSALEVDAGGL